MRKEQQKNQCTQYTSIEELQFVGEASSSTATQVYGTPSAYSHLDKCLPPNQCNEIQSGLSEQPEAVASRKTSRALSARIISAIPSSLTRNRRRQIQKKQCNQKLHSNKSVNAVPLGEGVEQASLGIPTKIEPGIMNQSQKNSMIDGNIMLQCLNDEQKHHGSIYGHNEVDAGYQSVQAQQDYAEKRQTGSDMDFMSQGSIGPVASAELVEDQFGATQDTAMTGNKIVATENRKDPTFANGNFKGISSNAMEIDSVAVSSKPNPVQSNADSQHASSVPTPQYFAVSNGNNQDTQYSTNMMHYNSGMQIPQGWQVGKQPPPGAYIAPGHGMGPMVMQGAPFPEAHSWQGVHNPVMAMVPGTAPAAGWGQPAWGGMVSNPAPGGQPHDVQYWRSQPPQPGWNPVPGGVGYVWPGHGVQYSYGAVGSDINQGAVDRSSNGGEQHQPNVPKPQPGMPVAPHGYFPSVHHHPGQFGQSAPVFGRYVWNPTNVPQPYGAKLPPTADVSMEVEKPPVSKGDEGGDGKPVRAGLLSQLVGNKDVSMKTTVAGEQEERQDSETGKNMDAPRVKKTSSVLQLIDKARRQLQGENGSPPKDSESCQPDTSVSALGSDSDGRGGVAVDDIAEDKAKARRYSTRGTVGDSAESGAHGVSVPVTRSRVAAAAATAEISRDDMSALLQLVRQSALTSGVDMREPCADDVARVTAHLNDLLRSINSNGQCSNGSSTDAAQQALQRLTVRAGNLCGVSDVNNMSSSQAAVVRDQLNLLLTTGTHPQHSRNSPVPISVPGHSQHQSMSSTAPAFSAINASSLPDASTPGASHVSQETCQGDVVPELGRTWASGKRSSRSSALRRRHSMPRLVDPNQPVSACPRLEPHPEGFPAPNGVEPHSLGAASGTVESDGNASGSAPKDPGPEAFTPDTDNPVLRRILVAKANPSAPLPEVGVNFVGRYLTHDVISQSFGRAQKDAAVLLGVSLATLKRACRRVGIARWPGSESGGRRVRAAASDAGVARTNVVAQQEGAMQQQTQFPIQPAQLQTASGPPTFPDLGSKFPELCDESNVAQGFDLHSNTMNIDDRYGMPSPNAREVVGTEGTTFNGQSMVGIQSPTWQPQYQVSSSVPSSWPYIQGLDDVDEYPMDREGSPLHEFGELPYIPDMQQGGWEV